MPLNEAAQDLQFDILSYPCNAVTDGLVVDVQSVESQRLFDLSRLSCLPAIIDVGGGGQKHPSVAFKEPERAFQSLGKNIRKVTVVSNRDEFLYPAMELGAGAVRVEGGAEFEGYMSLLCNPTSWSNGALYDNPLGSRLSYEDVAESMYRPDEVNVVGVVGRTGSGKTTTVKKLKGALDKVGGHGALLELDSFFTRTREERKRWLNEEGISDEEREKRSRVSNWWNFDLTADTVAKLRTGEPVHLEGMFEQSSGEKSAVIDIDPGSDGFTLFVEGTALLLPAVRACMDSFVYLNTHNKVRTNALMHRNLSEGYTEEESTERKQLTDAYETCDHLSRPLRVTALAMGELTVLDNTRQDDKLTLMPPCIPCI